MSAPNRVDELRKRYHENPRRYFAPLANEYRKTGFVDRAILLCEKHLGEQPGNMNGLVVYGQCLFETNRLEEARFPFEQALAVDPENLIALRHLGDIARQLGDAETARSWYRKLLELDRRNDEVLALLEEVGGAQEPPPAAAAPMPGIVSVAPSVSVSGAPDALGLVELESPAPPPAPVPVAPPAPVAPATPAKPAPAVTPPRSATPVDPSAKTVEVTAQARPAPRASLLDVSFDFGELGELATEAPPPPVAPRIAEEPLLPAEAAEYGFVAPTPAPSADEALDEWLTEVPSAEPPAAPTMPAAEALPMAPLIEASPEGESLSALPPIEGLQQAEFSAEVSPLAGLESTEFTSGEATPLGGLETTEFEPPRRPTAALEDLETVEFTPPSLSAIPTDALSGEIELPSEELLGSASAAPEPEPALPRLPTPSDVDALPELPMPDLVGDEEPTTPDPRRSVAGLPLLEPLGTPTPAATPVVGDLPLLGGLGDAETLRLDAGDVRRRLETPATFVTETMARVYVEQGHVDKAIEVYRQLIAQSPDDEGLRARLRALESGPDAGVAPITEVTPVAAELPAPASTEPTFEAPAARQSLGFTPIGVDAVEEAPPAADAMLSAMSFEGVRLSTPTPAPAAAAPAVPSGPTAREFFGKVARRAVTPVFTPSVAGPSAAGQLLSPLDALFGPEVPAEDEAAAHRLAGVGATSGPSGGSALDSLFGEGPSSPMPTPTSRPSVPRASQKLSFDQFFNAAPASEPEAMPEPGPEPDLEMESEAEAEPTAGDDDDLDQFQGWLRGLTQ